MADAKPPDATPRFLLGLLAGRYLLLQDVERQRVDAVVNLGDILSGPLLPAETADFLMQRPFVTIAGNHERQVLALKDRAITPDPLTSDGFDVPTTAALARGSLWVVNARFGTTPTPRTPYWITRVDEHDD